MRRTCSRGYGLSRKDHKLLQRVGKFLQPLLPTHPLRQSILYLPYPLDDRLDPPQPRLGQHDDLGAPIAQGNTTPSVSTNSGGDATSHAIS